MSLASLIPRLSVGWPGTRLVLAYRLLMSCVSEPDYKEEQSSELETLRCIYTDEELTGIHCVARLQTAAIEQLHWCHVPISSQKYQKTLPALKSRYPARMQMAPQVSH